MSDITPDDPAWEALQQATSDFLVSSEWKVLRVQEAYIQRSRRNSEGLPFRFKLEIEFIGAPLDTISSPPTSLPDSEPAKLNPRPANVIELRSRVRSRPL
jgi:hypothetical protein